MEDMFYRILVIVVALAGLFIGLRKGMVRQVAGLLGLAFGIVCSRVFHAEGIEIVKSWLPSLENKFASEIIYSVVATAVIFITVYLAFQIIGIALRGILKILHFGTINTIMGGVFGVFKYLFILSVVFNVIASIDQQSSLMQACRGTDGNLIEWVMPIAPAFLNSDFEELEYLLQVEEAKKISTNNSTYINVIITDVKTKTLNTTQIC